jgi:hypothetical protein
MKVEPGKQAIGLQEMAESWGIARAILLFKAINVGIKVGSTGP